MDFPYTTHRPGSNGVGPHCCRGCSAWVTGAPRCHMCDLGPLGRQRIADPPTAWQLSAVIEADLLVKRDVAAKYASATSEPVKSRYVQRSPSPEPLWRGFGQMSIGGPS